MYTPKICYKNALGTVCYFPVVSTMATATNELILAIYAKCCARTIVETCGYVTR